MERHRTQKWDTSSPASPSSNEFLRGASVLFGSSKDRLRSSGLWLLLMIFRHGIHLLLRPFFWLLNYRGDRINLRVETTSPVITGSLSLKSTSEVRFPLELHYGNETVHYPLCDVQVGKETISNGRRTHLFQINYPLKFGIFRPSKVRLTYGPQKSNFKRVVKKQATPDQRIVEPSQVITTGIKKIVGDPPNLGSADTRRDVAILSIFTGESRSVNGALRYLKDLKQNGFFVIVVDTSETAITETTYGSEVMAHIDLYIHRCNEGWDFASWFAVLHAYPEITQGAHRLLLTNDSNYGPIGSLSAILQKGRALNSGVWGLTDSWAIDYHLQSYFMEFDAPTLRNGHLTSFISQYPFPTLKSDVINEGEIGFTKYLLSQGVSLRALFPYETLAATFVSNFSTHTKEILALPENQLQIELGRSEEIYDLAFALDIMDSIRSSVPLDPTLHLWRSLLSAGGPFVKRKLVLTREGRFPGIENLPHLINEPEVMEVILSEAPERFIGYR
jgi:hypothetical protein